MAETTVIYFTANREEARFEARIRRSLLRLLGDRPLISVSHVPMDFGRNLCVGLQEPSTVQALRQIRLGAEAAETPFVCLAESDFLYPRDYVRFRPTRLDTAYLFEPIYVLFAQRGKAKVFCRKRGHADSAVIAGRERLIAAIDQALQPGRDPASIVFADVLASMRREAVTLSRPAITFKTDQNMHRATPHDRRSRCRELPDWGPAADLIRRYCG